MVSQCNLYNFEPEFKQYLERSSISRTSINNYLADLRSFISWLSISLKQQNVEFDSSCLSQKTFDDYKSYLILSGTPQSSINRQFSTLRAFVKCCIQNNWISYNPLLTVSSYSVPFLTRMKLSFQNNKQSIGLFIFGFALVFILFLIPGLFYIKGARSNQSLNQASLIPAASFSGKTNVASTSADLLMIPIIDAKGNLNLSASYPKIIGQNGTLTIEAPSLALTARDKGSIQFSVSNGALQFLFEGSTPPLPYESAFYFASKDLENGTLIFAQTGKTGSNINLLELSSGVPAEPKFSVDADGNVHVKGNIILEGNLIVNPASSIFGRLATETATSSYSPAP